MSTVELTVSVDTSALKTAAFELERLLNAAGEVPDEIRDLVREGLDDMKGETVMSRIADSVAYMELNPDGRLAKAMSMLRALPP